MSNKGGQTTLKRIAASKSRNVERKYLTFTIKGRAGPHTEENSVPLGFVLRDLLGLANNLKEAKIILNAGKVKVDGLVKKDYRLPVGLFDVVEIDTIKKAFRLVLEKHGRLETREIKAGAKLQKVCKIKGKKMFAKGKLQFVLNDGKTFIVAEKDAIAKAKPNDSFLLELPKKPVQVLELKKGHIVYLLGGKHVGETAKILDVTESTMQKPKLISLESENEQYSTVAKNVIVIGEAKSAIEF